MTEHDDISRQAEEILALRLRRRSAPTWPPSLVDSSRSMVSAAQERMWFLHEMNPASTAYLITSAARLTGQLDLVTLERSVAFLVARHEMLRSVFRADSNGQPARQVRANTTVPIEIVDLAKATNGQAAGAEPFLREWALRPFDIAAEPLARFLVLRLGDADQILAICLHHIIIDGWGLGVLHRELRETYAALRAGQEPNLPEVTPVPAAQQPLPADLAYWRTQLAALPQIELPMATPHPPVARFVGASHEILLPETLASDLERLAKQHHASLYMVSAAGFTALLHRYSGQQDIVVGTPVAGRDDPSLEHVIGLFVNSVVLRADLSGSPSFVDLLMRIRATVLAALAHQRLPFERLVEEIAPDRFLSHNPLFQVMFALQNARTDELELPGLSSSPVRIDTGTVRLDLECTLWRLPSGIRLRLNYNSDILSAAAIERFARHYRRLLTAAVTDPGMLIGNLDYLGSAERKRMDRHAIARPSGERRCLHELFEQAAARHPDGTAVRTATDRVSFADLDHRADRLASALADAGIGRGNVVALSLERSITLVTAILATWKAGAAFVPLNPDDPAPRRRFMVTDAGARLVLTDAKNLLDWDGVDVPVRDAGAVTATEPAARVLPRAASQDIAYVVYTSGTSGLPKGVMIEHRNAANTLSACHEMFGFTSSDVGMVLAPATFDVFYYELFAVMFAGGCSLLLDRAELFDISRICAALQEATVLHAVPGLMDHLLRSQQAQQISELPRMRHAVTGGDTVPGALLAALGKVFPNACICVAYGPTEAAIFTTFHAVARGQTPVGHPIGRPISGAEVRIADPDGRWLPDGVTGEIWIGGRGVARGYVARPEETAARFVATDSGRFYRSGDRGRYSPQGWLEFLGRADQQVKIRGHRIELGEVESVLAQVPGVRRALAVPQGDGPSDRRLVAYVLAADNVFARYIDTGAERQAIDHWHELFDRTHQERRPGDGKDYTGWNSSYDGRPIPDEDMDEWRDETLDRIRAKLGRRRGDRPMTVLEIGCGTGSLLLHLAPQCGRYVGTDLSAVVLAGLGAVVRQRNLSQVELYQAEASELPSVGRGFDAVIINSVAQYLPSAMRLEQLLDTAMRLTNRDGFVFVGDVRSLLLAEVFAISVEAARSPGSSPAEVLRWAAYRAQTEEELLAAPGMFTSWAERTGLAARVEIEPRFGIRVNELTKYRYDVTLWSSAQDEDAPAVWHQWTGGDWSESRVDSVLSGLRPARLGLRDIPNALLTEDLELGARLRADAGLGATEPSESQPITPGRLRQIAASRGYAVEVSWTVSGKDGAFDACLIRGQSSSAAAVAWPGQPIADGPVTNAPLLHKARSGFAASVREFAEQRLPAYMMPAAIIVVDAFPLTVHGKVDVTALPAVTLRSDQIRRDPATATERLVADAWAEVLTGERPGAGDDFFSSGGTSLQAIRIAVALRGRGIPFAPQQLFELRTVERIAAWIDKPAQHEAADGGSPQERDSAGTTTRGARRRSPDDVATGRLLLTGATGMLGIHVLNELWRSQPERSVVCLVRGSDDRAAEQRLHDQYSWYFPGQRFPDVKVLAADLALPRLGLAGWRWQALATEFDQILHVAADVRHVAPVTEVFAANVDGTSRLLDLAASSTDSRFHYVSSVAVAGRSHRDAVLSETQLDIGQSPTEAYSRSKIEAERLVRSFLDDGWDGTVLRVGTVAPHSETGRFQRNIDGHFFSRFIRAVLDLGLAADWPGRAFALTPADAMARIVLAITAQPTQGNTFHIQNPHVLSHGEITRILQAMGYPIRLVSGAEFAASVAELARSPQYAEAVGRALPLLAARTDKPVRLDCSWTLKRLAELGLEYPIPTSAWVRRFIHHGIAVGYFPDPQRGCKP